MNDQGFANLIYEYFVVRFHLEYYKYGESLPKASELCRQFGVSTLTIKSAFQRLQDKGYISRSRGRSARVLFRQSGQELDEYAIRFFSKRMAMVPDLYASTELVILPMLIKGLCLMDDGDFAFLEKLAQQTNSEDQMRFYCYILQKTQNPLAMNLFWESTLYFGLPFSTEHRGLKLYDVKVSRQRLKEIIEAGKARDPARIQEAHFAFQRDVSKNITTYISRHISNAPKNEQIPFVWRVYRDRPEICCSLAIQVFHDVYLGAFQGMEFLPSYEKMAQKYDVSVSTIRRTIGVLSQLGAAQPINGKGIRILMLQETENGHMPDLTVPKIRRNMAYYIQSFELLARSCEGVMCMALSALTLTEKNDLADLLKGYLHTGRCYITLQSIFAFVTEHCPLKGLQEIYGKLYGLSLWGYPMGKYRKEMPGLEQALTGFTETIVQSLQCNDANQFSKTIYNFMQSEYEIAKKILLEHGYEPADLTISPSFTLMSTEES